MTVHVTRDDGVTDDFARFGDRYIRHTDGSLEVIRAGTMQAKTYQAGRWSDVSGDEKRAHRRLFRHRA
ncbi:hypothetical protein [Mycolicibacterium vaccae]|jgi:hypothetical protein|uniref:Uncharacterized protein n=1 Tax=Mycolicibacterium vaccae ATCC 25954 TaxID=1194972 RepID=K0UZI7_MYCVA|nr:hypothetical protein [Mycolicibacterium vaccae]EJZ08008.1 hypothetical protein MVAC_16901 [Mycolicibacterium vaccae ATCC 25954]MCV7062585.1 hypothetical protein [Mycolicibacterium vaccae]